MSILCSAEINTQALLNNLARVRALAPGCKIMAMVKGNGYGHGMITVAQILAPHVDLFGVARLNEAVLLRERGIKTPILLMEGFTSEGDLPLIEQLQLDFVIHQRKQVDMLASHPLAKPRKAWLKIDTGMHRLGIFPHEFKEIYAKLLQNPSVDKDIGLMSHFAKADEVTDPFTLQQIQCFQQTIEHIKAPISLANSAAILAWPNTHGDWVRPGIMLYGVSPFPQENAARWDLEPVMTLKAELIAIKLLQKGDTVGYGGTWVCPKAMKIGILAIGYGDGYPRYIQNGAPVLIDGKYVPLVGRVSMDMITVDLSALPQVSLGTQATLWGKDLPIEQVARWANTSAYELLCGVTGRVTFITL